MTCSNETLCILTDCQRPFKTKTKKGHMGRVTSCPPYKEGIFFT